MRAPSIAARYDAAFAGSRLLERPPRRDGDGHAWHLYVVRLNLDAISIGRGEVIERLGEAGIGASVHFIPLHLHPHYQRRYGYAPGDFPIAEAIFERSISLPDLARHERRRRSTAWRTRCSRSATRRAGPWRSDAMSWWQAGS